MASFITIVDCTSLPDMKVDGAVTFEIQGPEDEKRAFAFFKEVVKEVENQTDPLPLDELKRIFAEHTNPHTASRVDVGMGAIIVLRSVSRDLAG